MKKTRVITNVIIVSIFVVLSAIAFPINRATATASVNPNVIYQGNLEKNNVCFMFNVYWGTEYIKDILDVLDFYEVKTTFFVGGSWSAKNTETLKEIYMRGHEIANHGYNHKDQDKLTKKQNEDEIMMTHKLIQANLGIEMNLFAPPSGAYDNELVDIALELNYKTIMWSHDTIDWRDKDSELIFKRATENLSNGDLILMHPTEHSLNALSNILSYASNNGYNATTVTNTIST